MIFYLNLSKYDAMRSILDRPEQMETLDRGGMLKFLGRFPESCKETVEAVERLPLVDLPRGEFKAVIIAGVGGSAIGGHLLRDWLLDSCPVSIHISRGYRLPRFVDDETLVFAVSYSGNTEETLGALRDALERGCTVIALTSGGEMRRLSAEKGIPCLSLPRGMLPRAALPNQFFSLATVMRRLDLASGLWGEVAEAFEILEGLRNDLAPEMSTASNPAKLVANGLRGLVPFVYGPRMFEAVAYRICTELNENSKVPAGSGFFPEAFHNAVMGCEAPEDVRRHVCVLIIRDPEGLPHIRRKIDGFKQLMESGGVRVLEIPARGRGRLARMLSVLYIGDYAATYLGLLHGLDPSSMDSIEALKRI